MASTIDYSTLALGALVGVGCREQLKAAAKIAATTAASLASSAAVAVNSAAAQMYGEESQSPASTSQGTPTPQGKTV